MQEQTRYLTCEEIPSGCSYDEAEHHIVAREFEKAVNCLTKAINLQPKAVLYYVERAEILYPISDEITHSLPLIPATTMPNNTSWRESTRRQSTV